MALSSSSNSVPYVVYFPKLYLICPETGLCGKIFFFLLILLYTIT